MANYEETLRRLRTQMQTAVRKASEESQAWNREKAALMKQHGSGTPELRMATQGSLVMKDALAGCKFHAEIATMFATVLTAEVIVHAELEARGANEKS